MVIGSSTYAFTIVLSTFLIGLAGGAAIGAWLIRRDFDPRLSWGIALALTIGFLGLGTTYIDQLPELFIGLVRTSHILETASPSGLFMIEGIISAIPILLPTLCMGAFFPLSLGMAKHDSQRVGQSIGWLYAANTVGSIIGTIITGFVLIPVFGLETGIRVCIMAYALCILILARQAHIRPLIQRVKWPTLSRLMLHVLLETNIAFSSISRKPARPDSHDPPLGHQVARHDGNQDRLASPALLGCG